MTGNSTLQFADDYAWLKEKLEKGHSWDLSTRGVAHALLAVLGELRAGNQDAVAAVSKAISVYRAWEEQDAVEEAEYEAAEERRREARRAAEDRARTVRCPSCDARPGEPCHRPDGTAIPESHKRRYKMTGHPRGIPGGSASHGS